MDSAGIVHFNHRIRVKFGIRCQPCQFLLGLFTFRDVIKKNGDLPILRLPDTKSVDIIPSVQLLGTILKAGRLSSQSDLTICFKPMLFMSRG